MLKPILGLILSYLLGSIPTGYLSGRAAKGIDLRKYGSGNMGATNAFRVLGKGIGTTVLILDILKGIIALLLAKSVFFSPDMGISLNLFLCLAAVAVVSGHNWTVFLGFKGGKGVATSLGVLIAFCIVIDKFTGVVLSIIVLWLGIFLLSGFVSLASVICSVLLPVFAIFFQLPREIVLFLSLLALLSLIRHKPNILRLLQKKESRFNTKALFSRKTLSR